MKVVKTQSNWSLKKRGYPVAFRFATHSLMSANHPYHKIIDWLKANRGPQSHWEWTDDKHTWTTYTGRASNWREPTPYFIGLKDETDVSVILLSIGDKL